MQTSYERLSKAARGQWRIPRLQMIYPVVILVLGIAIDCSRMLDFSVTPVVCILSLIVFSLFLPSRQLILWTVLYVLVIAGALWVQRDKWSTPDNNAEALVATRILVASGAGVLACLYAMRREQADATYVSIIQLIEQFSLPVVMSDSNGWLIHMNTEALKIFGKKKRRALPFMSTFPIYQTKVSRFRLT